MAPTSWKPFRKTRQTRSKLSATRLRNTASKKLKQCKSFSASTSSFCRFPSSLPYTQRWFTMSNGWARTLLLNKHNKKRTPMGAPKYQWHKAWMSSHRRNTFQNMYKVEKDSKMISTVAFKKTSPIDNHQLLLENSFTSKKVERVSPRPKTEYRNKASCAFTINI